MSDIEFKSGMIVGLKLALKIHEDTAQGSIASTLKGAIMSLELTQEFDDEEKRDV